MNDPEKGYPVTPCMDVYKAKIQSDISLDKFKLRIVVRGYFQNKDLIVDTWSPTVTTSNVKYLLEDASNHKEIV